MTVNGSQWYSIQLVVCLVFGFMFSLWSDTGLRSVWITQLCYVSLTQVRFLLWNTDWASEAETWCSSLKNWTETLSWHRKFKVFTFPPSPRFTVWIVSVKFHRVNAEKLNQRKLLCACVIYLVLWKKLTELCAAQTSGTMRWSELQIHCVQSFVSHTLL